MSNLPIFTGDIRNREDVARYLTSPTNKALATQDELIAGLISDIASKPSFYSTAVEPDYATKGDRWTSSVTGYSYECNDSYLISEVDKPSKWTAVSDEIARTQLQLQANEGQANGAFIDQVFIDYGNDGTITPTEKLALEGFYSEAKGEKVGIDSSVTFYQLVGSGEYVNYVSKYNALVTYVDTTTDLFGDMGLATLVVIIDWNTVWTEFRSARSALRTLILATSNAVIENLQGDVDSVQNNIDTISNDSIISKSEKPALYREWTDVIQVNKLKLDALATTLGLTGELTYTTYVTDYNNLNTYLNTTLTLFAPLSADTDLVANGSNSIEFQGFFNTYYVSQGALDQFLDERFETNIDDNRAEYLQLISDIANDGVISGGTEKQQLLQTWKDIQSEKNRLGEFASQYSVIEPASYTSAYDALDIYLNTTLGIFTSMTTDTLITPSVFYDTFDLYRVEGDAYSDLIVTAQKLAVETGDPDFPVIKQQVENIASDGIVSKGAEKIRAIAIWNGIVASHNEFLSIANKTGISTVNLQTKYDALEVYLNALTPSGGGSPNFFVDGEDTSIGALTFVTNFQNYGVARDELVRLAVDALSDGVTAVTQNILDINNDGVVSVIEKKTLAQNLVEFTTQVANLDTQADTLSIVAEKNAMDTAWNDLNTFLDSLESGQGLFFDVNSPTVLTTGEINDWDLKWSNFFTTKSALETIIITTVQANVVSLNSSVILKDGTVSMEANLDMETGGVKNYILNLKEFPVGVSNHASTVNQIYTEQLARINAIAQEVIDRNLAIGSAISTEVSDRDTAIGLAVANLLASAPATLDTLNELAQALNDDPNFATTMTNALALKASLTGASFSGAVSAPSFNVP